MNENVYEAPRIERVVIVLEHAIAGSVPAGGGRFEEKWEEEKVDTGDIVLM